MISEDRKEYLKNWRARNAEKLRRYKREYYKKNQEQVLEYITEYNKKHPPVKRTKLQNKIQSRKNNIRRRNRLFDILGGPRCAKCGFSDLRALQFDHINGGGVKDAKRIGYGSKLVFYYIHHIEEAKSTLQVLCANCNWIKRDENKECELVTNYSSQE